MHYASDNPLSGQTVLVTGAARRIGAAICETLHAAGMNVAIHYRNSSIEADQLAARLNADRDGSAKAFCADLIEAGEPADLVREVTVWADSLDALVNNASTFYPTPLANVDEMAWNDLIGSNLKAPLFLSLIHI